jgi:CRISPR-associated protein (TIGR02710 family)
MTTVKAMIVSVGGTPEPIVKTIEHHKPAYVCFFASQATNDRAIKVRELLGAQAASVLFETELVDDENDLLECYEKAGRAVIRLQKRRYAKDNVTVDYTGATKNMSVALALAAIDQGYAFSYVGGDKRTRNGVGTVECGHERIFTHLNPWDFMAVQEKRLASIYFNTCQFKACRDLLNELAERASIRRSVYRKLAFAVEGFLYWDLFRHTDALESFRRARLDELEDDRERGVVRFAKDCLQLRPSLEAILTCSDKGKTPCAELALDLFANAERRFAEGKVDDAVLRIYRLVEMLAQERLLKRFGIDVSDVRPDQLPHQSRDEFIQKYKNKRTGKIEIPQSPSYQLLKELGDELGEAFSRNFDKFRNVQSARNTSYLAHGFQSSKDSVYEKLREFVVELGAIDSDNVSKFPLMEL